MPLPELRLKATVSHIQLGDDRAAARVQSLVTRGELGVERLLPRAPSNVQSLHVRACQLIHEMAVRASAHVSAHIGRSSPSGYLGARGGALLLDVLPRLGHGALRLLHAALESRSAISSTLGGLLV